MMKLVLTKKIVGNLEDAEDLMGELRVTDKTGRRCWKILEGTVSGMGNEDEGEERTCRVGRKEQKSKGRKWRKSGTETHNVSDNARPSFVSIWESSRSTWHFRSDSQINSLESFAEDTDGL